MPIEIRELHIKAIIDSDEKIKTNGIDGSQIRESPEEKEAGTDMLIDTCVQKILDILKEKKER